MSWDLYENHPWASVATNKRDWLVPALLDWYVRKTTYSRFVTTVVNHLGPRAEQITFTKLIAPHPNFNELSLRQMWMPSSYTDSKAKTVSFKHYGGKMALHAYDDLITYWQQNGRQGLVNIINNGLGVMMTRTMDTLARNAFLSAPYTMYGTGSGDKFANLTADDTISTELLEDIHLGMNERGVPFEENLDEGYGTMFCITSPGVLRDLRFEASENGNANAFIDVRKYQQATQIINGEIGSYHGVRFIQANDACLYNCGAIEHQTTIEAPVSAGDGAPGTTMLVDGVYNVGQRETLVTNYIQVADASGFEVGDRVTVHQLRTNDFGVTNGMDYRDGKAQLRRIVKIDGNNISFDEPIMEPLETALLDSSYGYVTKAAHVHSALFVGGMDGVVMSSALPPTIVTPRPIDDVEEMYRISWHGRFGYNLFEPKSLELVYLAGSNRFIGQRTRL